MKLSEINEFKRRTVHSSLKETSKDSSGNGAYMVESLIQVVNFDLVKRYYWNERHFSEESSKSVDALVDGKSGKIYLIEFKNGGFSGIEIDKKIKDSLLIINSILKWQLEIDRTYLAFVLVYDGDDKCLTWKEKRAMHLAKRGKSQYVPFGLSGIRGAFFSEVEVIEKNDFESSSVFADLVPIGS